VDGLRHLVDARRPHIIETHHVKSHCLVALSGLWRRHTWVAFHHGYTQTDLKVRAYNHVDRWSLRRAAHVVTTNEPFGEQLVERGVDAARITVLHNGVRQVTAAEPAVHALRQALGLRRSQPVVLAIGRLSREKGQCHLIRAAALWRGGARLVIVGDGPDRASLEGLARDLGLGDTVIFAGLTQHVAPFYALADVFVLPSLSEGSPNVLLEAMASGLPVVATRVGGVPEIAADGTTALLGPAKDPAFIARAVDRLLADRDLASRLGAAARRTVLSRHTPERRAATLSRLYSTLAGGPAAQVS
jgi:glycosyltransferase involved in cell wall biosynthesis